MEVNQKSNYTTKSYFFRQKYYVQCTCNAHAVTVTVGSARMLGPSSTFIYILYQGYFDAGCWVRQRETNKGGEEKNEPKRGRLVDQ